jgi:hypothetical protein
MRPATGASTANQRDTSFLQEAGRTIATTCWWREHVAGSQTAAADKDTAMRARAEPEAPVAPATPTKTETKRGFTRFRFPWQKTKVASRGDEEELIVLNSTRVPWALHLGYRSLGDVEPGQQVTYLVVKRGALTARQLAGDGTGASADHLSVQITGRVRRVELRYRRLGATLVHDLQVTERPAA